MIWGKSLKKCTTDTQLLADEMDFLRSARKYKKEKFRNDTIRGCVDMGKNVIEVIEEEG
jgi:hypothetical protein